MANYPIRVREGHSACVYDMLLNIEWLPTYLCNYRCSYCNQGRPKGKDWLDAHTAKKMFDKIRDLNRSSYIINISGGEPTFYPYLTEVLEHVAKTYSDRLAYIYISSNGSNDEATYEKIAKLSRDIPIFIRISIHTEHVDSNQLEFLTRTLSNSVRLSFSLMHNPAKREYTHDLFDFMCALRQNWPFNLNIAPLVDFNPLKKETRYNPSESAMDGRYTEEDLHWQTEASAKFLEIATNSSKKITWGHINLYDSGQECVLTDRGYECKELGWQYQNLKDMYCVMGTNIIFIDPAGYATNGGNCAASVKSQKPIYVESPYDDQNFALIKQCAQDICGCHSNVWLPKFFSLTEAQTFLAHFKIKQKRLVEEREKDKECSHLLSAMERVVCSMKTERQILMDAVDKPWYLRMYPDVAENGMDAGVHYFKYGWREGRIPAPWFEPNVYLLEHPEVVGKNPFEHYLTNNIKQWTRHNTNIKQWTRHNTDSHDLASGNHDNQPQGSSGPNQALEPEISFSPEQKKSILDKITKIEGPDVLEEIIEETLKNVIVPGSYAIDGGAHVGRHTEHMLKTVTQKGRVYAVEAIDELYQSLSSRLESNPAYIGVNNALYDRSGVLLNFNHIVNRPGFSGLELKAIPHGEVPRIRHLQVRSLTLDDMTKNEPRKCTAIKLDLEGAEYFALLGARRILENDRPVIVFEDGRESTGELYGFDYREIYRYLKSLGYTLVSIFGEVLATEDKWAETNPWYTVALPADRLEVCDLLGKLYEQKVTPLISDII